MIKPPVTKSKVSSSVPTSVKSPKMLSVCRKRLSFSFFFWSKQDNRCFVLFFSILFQWHYTSKWKTIVLKSKTMESKKAVINGIIFSFFLFEVQLIHVKEILQFIVIKLRLKVNKQQETKHLKTKLPTMMMPTATTTVLKLFRICRKKSLQGSYCRPTFWFLWTVVNIKHP